MGFTSAASILKNTDETVRAAVTRTIMNASDDIQSTARDTVREWRNKAEFAEELTVERLWVHALVKPKGDAAQIFEYVDLGTKPHIIAPKTEGGRLFFKTGYSTRTAPIGKYNLGTGESFGPKVAAKVVHHPGFPGRFFLKSYLEELLPSLQIRTTTEIATSLER